MSESDRLDPDHADAASAAHVRAGIALHGSALRYVEVERYGARYRLLRLGSCDFDFDVARALLDDAEPARAETVAEALHDVFLGTTTKQLTVALHPPVCTSFFTPLPAEQPAEERREQLLQEARLLARPIATTAGDAGLHLTTGTLPAGTDGEEWVHALALPRRAYDRLEGAVQDAAGVPCRVVLSTRSAARLLLQAHPQARLPEGDGHVASSEAASSEADDAAEAICDLAVGWYDTHIEYALCRDGYWHFSHHAPAGPPVDSAYFAAAMLDHLSIAPATLRSVRLYGQRAEEEAFAALGTALGLRPQRLDPMSLIDLDPGNLAPDFNAASYVPCIGTVL